MGWASGERVFADVVVAVEKHLPKDKRKEIINELVDIFQSYDADTLFDDPDYSPTLMEICKERYPDDE